VIDTLLVKNFRKRPRRSTNVREKKRKEQKNHPHALREGLRPISQKVIQEVRETSEQIKKRWTRRVDFVQVAKETWSSIFVSARERGLGMLIA